jgi:hypothetical protein
MFFSKDNRCQCCGNAVSDHMVRIGEICSVCGWEEDILDEDGRSCANSGLTPVEYAVRFQEGTQARFLRDQASDADEILFI